MRTLRYGHDAILRFDIPDHVRVTDRSEPRGKPLNDLDHAVIDALADPLDFPPIHQAAVSGDRIVIAVEDGMPQLGNMLKGTIEALLKGDVRPEDISVLLGSTVHNGDLPELADPGIHVARHDPDDVSSLAYLAASKSARPIYLNRLLCDADVIVPLGVLRHQSAPAYYGIYGSLFPTFSDRQTRHRFQHNDSDDWARHQQKCRKESREVTWLLGSLFSVQIIPGGGDAILQVIAGDQKTVAKRGQSLFDSAWSESLDERPDLIVASIVGDETQQSWENVGRALALLSNAMATNGSVVLCTELAVEPGPAMQRLTTISEDEIVPKRIRHDHSADGLSANGLANVRANGRLFLMSNLEEDVVESLGIASIAGAAEIERLIRSHGTCLLLGNAHYAHLELES